MVTGCCSPEPPILCSACNRLAGSIAGERYREARQIPSAHSRGPLLRTKDQAETSVLFELIAARYERRSLIVTSNPSFLLAITANWRKSGKNRPGPSKKVAM